MGADSLYKHEEILLALYGLKGILVNSSLKVTKKEKLARVISKISGERSRAILALLLPNFTGMFLR